MRIAICLRRLAPAVLLGIGLMGCSDGRGGGTPTQVPPPDPGILEVRLTTPNTDDAGIVFTVSGGPITSVEAAGFEQKALLKDNTATVLVRGKLASGTIAKIGLPDRKKIASYTAHVSQAVAEGTYQQQATQGYQIQLARP